MDLREVIGAGLDEFVREAAESVRNVTKAHIPAVAVEIGLILGLLGSPRLWSPAIEDYLREELPAARDDVRRGAPPEDVVAAILGSIYALLSPSLPVPPQIARGSARRLLRASKLLPESSDDARAVARAVQDLGFRLGGRAASREEAVRAALTAAVTGELPEDSEGAEGGATASGELEGAIEAVRKGLDDYAEQSQLVTVDSWAYRTTTAGSVLAAELASVEAIVVDNNPPFGPDFRTTQFCRWAHGRSIQTERASRIVDGYYAAVSARDEEAARAAWPVLDDSTASGQGDEFEELVVGLPPYHNLCRSSIRFAIRPRR